MVTNGARREWNVDGARASAARRPDGQWLVTLPAKRPDLWRHCLARVIADIPAPLLVSQAGDLAEPFTKPLQQAGFVASRVEQLWRIPIAALPGGPIMCASHRLVSVDNCDLTAAVELDNAIRNDIPGTELWAGAEADLRDTLSDPEFDPDLYLIAEHTVTHSLDGLIRVWNRPGAPRLGCLGVRQAWRRTRLPAALVSTVTATLRRRGVTEIVTETDVRNAGSHPMAAHHGGIRAGTTIEWQYDPRRAGIMAAARP